MYILDNSVITTHFNCYDQDLLLECLARMLIPLWDGFYGDDKRGHVGKMSKQAVVRVGAVTCSWGRVVHSDSRRIQ